RLSLGVSKRRALALTWSTFPTPPPKLGIAGAEQYASTMTTYCAACSMRDPVSTPASSAAPRVDHILARVVLSTTPRPSLLRQHAGVYFRAKLALGNRRHAGRRAADRAGSLARGRRVRSVQAATKVMTAQSARLERTGRIGMTCKFLLCCCCGQDALLLRPYNAPWGFTKDTLETLPDKRQHARRRGNVMPTFWVSHACAHDAPYPSQGAREVGMDAETTQPLIQNAATLCVLRHIPALTHCLLTPSALECNPIPVLSAQGPVLGFFALSRPSARRRAPPMSPRVFLKRGRSVDSAPDVYDVSRLFSDAAPCSATRGCRIQASDLCEASMLAISYHTTFWYHANHLSHRSSSAACLRFEHNCALQRDSGGAACATRPRGEGAVVGERVSSVACHYLTSLSHSRLPQRDLRQGWGPSTSTSPSTRGRPRPLKGYFLVDGRQPAARASSPMQDTMRVDHEGERVPCQ
ncbi:hypothetical protein GGF50DRAFT_93172, partial [Schizophyllum commune]